MIINDIRIWVDSYVTKKIDETITISVEQYSEKKLQLSLLGGNFFLKKFNKRGWRVLIRKGRIRQKSRKLFDAYLAL